MGGVVCGGGPSKESCICSPVSILLFSLLVLLVAMDFSCSLMAAIRAGSTLTYAYVLKLLWLLIVKDFMKFAPG